MKFPNKINSAIILALCIFAISSSSVFSEILKTKDFQMDFPKKPAYEKQNTESEIGNLPMDIYIYDASNNEKDDNLVYGLISTEYPDSLINSNMTDILSDFFNNAIQGAVSNVSGKLISQTDLKLNNFPGREIKINYNDGAAVIKMRLFLVQNKMYILQTITLTEKDSNKSIDKFMNSFKLLK